jgi:hypothetical protein
LIATASFYANQTRRVIGEKSQQFCSLELFPDRFALGAQAIAVKDVLCDVQANYIIHFGLLFAPLFIVGCIMTPWE